MHVIRGRNVHAIFPKALAFIHEIGIKRDSRNGPVLQSSEPVATVYECPTERVMFWSERDANPFFHLYESLWMLAGRNDLKGPRRYVSTFGQFSDDGQKLWGAYGHRWRKWPAEYPRVALGQDLDQLKNIAEALKKNPECRRQVLAMWDPVRDLGREGKDLPCNDTATFQIGPDGRLNLVVFCRSNDIIWGCYGANAVHFSYLLEYMALWIGVPVGTYTQISVNWHAYLNTLQKVESLVGYAATAGDSPHLVNPYRWVETPRGWTTRELESVPMRGHIGAIDSGIHNILTDADNGYIYNYHHSDPWLEMCNMVLMGHHIWKSKGKDAAIEHLKDLSDTDWGRASIEWLERRAK